MRKIIAGVLVAVVGIVIVAILFVNHSDKQVKAGDAPNQAETALGNEWKKKNVTEVTDLVYSAGEGNTIVYHICITTYHEGESATQTGLNTEAISAVIHPDEADRYRECTVDGLPAALYQKDDRAYLCWTILPELSCVIEYNPAVVSEEDIFRMAESVPANQSKTEKP